LPISPNGHANQERAQSAENAKRHARARNTVGAKESVDEADNAKRSLAVWMEIEGPRHKEKTGAQKHARKNEGQLVFIGRKLRRLIHRFFPIDD